MRIKKGDILKSTYRKSRKFVVIFEVTASNYSELTYLYGSRIRVSGPKKGITYEDTIPDQILINNSDGSLRHYEYWGTKATL